MSLMFPPSCSPEQCHLGSHKILQNLGSAILDLLRSKMVPPGWSSKKLQRSHEPDTFGNHFHRSIIWKGHKRRQREELAGWAKVLIEVGCSKKWRRWYHWGIVGSGSICKDWPGQVSDGAGNWGCSPIHTYLGVCPSEHSGTLTS